MNLHKFLKAKLCQRVKSLNVLSLAQSDGPYFVLFQTMLNLKTFSRIQTRINGVESVPN